MTIKAVTYEEMREIDRISIDEIGIPAAVLMNNAGRSIAEFIEKRFKDKKIVFFCGTGNNGGDGFTAAYYLFNKGITPEIYLSGKKTRVSEISAVFMKLCEKCGIGINEVDENNLSSIKIPPDSIIVDAILGTGLTEAPSGLPRKLIRIINSSDNITVSVDIPSGLSADGDAPPGDCVLADYTITIGLPKISLVTYPCRTFCGELTIQDIGFPVSLTSDEKLKVSLTGNGILKNYFLNNSEADIHKGDRGHTLLIGGFSNMEGAALLAASALFNSGCGLVTIATSGESREIIAGKIPEAMTLSLPDDPDTDRLPELFKSKRFTSLLLGPGLGRTPYSEKIFNNVIKSLHSSGIKKVLIDGDGLFHLADYITRDKLPGNTDYIITPHFMEASRLLKKDIDTIKNSRLKACKELSLATGCITVLKGPASIISDGNKSYINTTGNSGLATAGSGDVLSGIICALMNADTSVIESAAAGVYIHGLCADLYSETSPSRTIRASDIINIIRAVLKLKSDLYKN